MHPYNKPNTWNNVTRVKPEEINKLELTDYLTVIKGNDELKKSIEDVLVDGSKINAIKILRTYMEVELDAKSTTTLRGCKNAIDYYALRYTLTKKIKWCRDMIEVYCNANGYGKMKNYKEVKSKKDDRYTWQYSDWEFVDDMYGHIVNDEDWMPSKQVLKDINDIHKKYRLPKYNKKGEYI